ncbi:MAG: helix-turn-helix transcriptional regulator [Bacteroidales bacterium]|nr:helix-turn-helix transcriptional regulator [Bacteroidales bacterium]
MITIPEIAVFILSLAIASGGILISSHLRTTYKAGFMSSLLFFQVFWFTFGFYVPWGQIIIVTVLEPVIEPKNLEKITYITLLLGSPFLVFAWLMYLKLTREISNMKFSNRLIIGFLAFNFFCIPGIIYLIAKLTGIQAAVLVKYAVIITSLLYIIAGIYFLGAGKRKMLMLYHQDVRTMTFWLLVLMAAQHILFFFSDAHAYVKLAFILLFFCFGGFIPVFFRYRADLSKLLISSEDNVSFDRFCEKFEISKREREVIHEICAGFTNQQIADKLFISLQTVKDHTHRIYGKTNCTSRAQLIRMVNEST